MRALVVLGVLSSCTFATAQTLDLQAMCATQARKTFQELEYEFKSDSAGKMFATVSNDYQNHYNTKIKKCLMLTEATRMLGNQSSTSVTLLDAFERRTYASYLWIARENKKYWEVPPMACELSASNRLKKNCTSREEFDAFVAEYMEE